MTGILLLMVLAFASVLVWRDGMRAKETAVDVCKTTCRAYGVQFLDDTVALLALGLRRGPAGRIGVRRVYQFEYSTSGSNRVTGSITLSGSSVEAIYIVPEAPQLPTPARQ